MRRCGRNYAANQSSVARWPRRTPSAHRAPGDGDGFSWLCGPNAGKGSLSWGVRDFCQNAKVHSFREDDHQVDVAGSVAAVTFRYEMVYEREGKRFRSTGRDLWLFQSQNESWIAVWRTMLDVAESPA